MPQTWSSRLLGQFNILLFTQKLLSLFFNGKAGSTRLVCFWGLCPKSRSLTTAIFPLFDMPRFIFLCHLIIWSSNLFFPYCEVHLLYLNHLFFVWLSAVHLTCTSSPPLFSLLPAFWAHSEHQTSLFYHFPRQSLPLFFLSVF